MSARLELDSLTHRYRRGDRAAVRGLSLEVRPGELVALLGPSGCGKTTALKVISGLLHPTSGDVLVDGVSLLGIPPERREAAMVFQKPLLFPNMNVRENIGFGLKMQRASRAQSGQRIEKALAQVRLEDSADRKPAELSGGQQQRVSLARALVTEPKLLLLDEPLSSLDANLREEMRALIKRLQREGGYTTVFVTHDQEEAVVLADRVALLFDGELQMHDEPEAFYERPSSRRVARFFGATNFIEGESENGSVSTSLGYLRLENPPPEGSVTLTIRPEAVRLEDGENSFSARVSSATYLGTQVHYELDARGARVRAALPPHVRLEPGEKVTARLPPESLWTLENDPDA